MLFETSLHRELVDTPHWTPTVYSLISQYAYNQHNNIHYDMFINFVYWIVGV